MTENPLSAPVSSHHRPSLPLRAAAWLGFLVYAWFILACVGAIAGTVLWGGLHVLINLSSPDLWAEKLTRGTYFGFLYLGKIWGPGGAIVWGFVKAHRLRKDGKQLTEAFFWPLGG